MSSDSHIFNNAGPQKGAHMRSNKIRDLNLTASVDTLSIVSPEISQANPNELPWVTRVFIRQNGYSDRTNYEYRFNLNNIAGEIYSLPQFEQTLSTAMDAMGISEYRYIRIDFRINSEVNAYEEYLKLNKCLLLLFTLKYRVKNRYQSIDPLMLDSLTVRVQNQYFEVENYNKELEEPGGNVINRLELRRKRIRKGTTCSELITSWIMRLNSLPAYYSQLQENCNKAIYDKWLAFDNKEGVSFSQFIWKYEQNIFSRRQLIKLFELNGSKNPEKAADHFKRRRKIEFFSEHDLRAYIALIVQALEAYRSPQEIRVSDLPSVA